MNWQRIDRVTMWPITSQDGQRRPPQASTKAAFQAYARRSSVGSSHARQSAAQQRDVWQGVQPHAAYARSVDVADSGFGAAPRVPAGSPERSFACVRLQRVWQERSHRLSVAATGMGVAGYIAGECGAPLAWEIAGVAAACCILASTWLMLGSAREAMRHM